MHVLVGIQRCLEFGKALVIGESDCVIRLVHQTLDLLGNVLRTKIGQIREEASPYNERINRILVDEPAIAVIKAICDELVITRIQWEGCLLEILYGVDVVSQPLKAISKHGGV